MLEICMNKDCGVEVEVVKEVVVLVVYLIWVWYFVLFDFIVFGIIFFLRDNRNF